MTDLTFSQALTNLKSGDTIRRSAWPAEQKMRLQDNGGAEGTNPYLEFFENGEWSARPFVYQPDMMAEDWLVVE